jgi:hypothetical protein
MKVNQFITIFYSDGGSPAMAAASAYQVRVLADSGTIEGYQCMVDKLTFLFDNP